MCLHGGIGRRSFDALTLNTIADDIMTAAAATAVFAFHALGAAHQPMHACVYKSNTFC